ncbi:hypothetical protein C0991_006697 [Blastosporella zonata]|nr:hypothetical protein C0991_006697 [Blastosporella zonata]
MAHDLISDFQSTHPSSAALSDPDEIAILEAVQSNSLLDDSTRIAAQTLLVKAENDLVVLDDEISRVQKILNELQHRRRTKAAHGTAYSSASAPLRKLANEILSYIFVLCCCDSSVTPKYDPGQQQHILGKVCSKWRRLSLDTPHIWSRIDVDYTRYGEGEHQPHDSKVPSLTYEAFLRQATRLCQMSGKVPLSLAFTKTAHLRTNSLDPFAPYFGRVTELYIHWSPNTIRSLFALPFGALPSLRTLDLKGNDIDLSKAHDLLRTPTLRNLSCSFRQTESTWMGQLPLSQLTRLIIPSTILAPIDLLSLLALTPNLTEGSFTTNDRRTLQLTLPTVDHSLPIELPHLHSLNISPFQPFEGQELHGLILPNLRRFVIQTGTSRKWDVGWMPTILRSGILETLRIEDHILLPHEITQILSLTPHLRELELGSGQTFTSSILQKMAIGELVPKLTKLRCFIARISLSPRNYGTLDLHLDMLEHRRSATTAARDIADVTFVIAGNPDAKDAELFFPGLKRMKRMVEESLWNIRSTTHID